MPTPCPTHQLGGPRLAARPPSGKGILLLRQEQCALRQQQRPGRDGGGGGALRHDDAAALSQDRRHLCVGIAAGAEAPPDRTTGRVR